MACFNSGHRVEDHFVGVTEMVAIGSGAERPVKTILLSRYACYLAIQNADTGTVLWADHVFPFKPLSPTGILLCVAVSESGRNPAIYRAPIM